jgi:pimeloyl-ACP methyl ester carboxylesterase
MKKIITATLLFLHTIGVFSQQGKIVQHQATLFEIKQKTDTISFIVMDTLLTEKKPIFLWCQGSLPIPLFCEFEEDKFFLFGGGIANFDYKAIAKKYHLVIISMPKTPVFGQRAHLNAQYQYVPDIQKPNEFLSTYIEADYLDNYVNRALSVLRFLNKKPWVDKRTLIVAGHSQGTKVATKIAIRNKKVTHLGLFAANPFGRIDQFVRQARLDAQLGKITWAEADSIMNDQYAFYRSVHDTDAKSSNPSFKAWHTFSETFYDDWLSLKMPIYLAYGTEDRTADLCDIVPLFFIQEGKNNFTFKRYLGLEHNFFEVNERGRANYEKSHWSEVMDTFLKWIK